MAGAKKSAARKSKARKSKARKSSARKSSARKSPARKSPIPKLNKGTLSVYGYEDVRRMNASDRHTSLIDAVEGIAKKNKITEREAALIVFRKLNVVATLKKNTLPNDSVLHKRDANWVSRHFL